MVSLDDGDHNGSAKPRCCSGRRRFLVVIVSRDSNAAYAALFPRLWRMFQTWELEI